MTLVAYHNLAITAYTSLVSGATTDLKDGTADFVAAEGDKATAINDIATKEAERAALLKELAAISVPADATSILAELETKLMELHSAQRDLLDATSASVAAAGKMAKAEAQLARGKAGLASETTAKAQAEADAAEAQAYKDAIDAFSASVTATIASYDAVTLANQATAKGKVETAFPASLRTTARTRQSGALALAATKQAAVDAAITHINTQLNANGGLAGKSAKATSLYNTARAALQDAALQTLARIDRALGLFAGVAGFVALDTDVQDNINALAADAAQAEADYQQALTDNGNDETVQAVIDAKALRDAANDKVEVAVPDTAWQALFNFDDAVRILEKIKAADFTAIKDDFDDQEDALSTALTNEITDVLDRALKVELLLEVVPIAQDAASPSLIFSALRGD